MFRANGRSRFYRMYETRYHFHSTYCFVSDRTTTHLCDHNDACELERDPLGTCAPVSNIRSSLAAASRPCADSGVTMDGADVRLNHDK